MHILFCMTKVLGVPPENPLVWQQALVEREINMICSGQGAREARARRDETGGESISSAQHAGSYLFSRSFARAHVSRVVGGVERVRAWVD